MPDGTFEVRESYESIKSIHISTGKLRDRGIHPGTSLTFVVEGVPDFSHVGKLSSEYGLVSGMAAVYKRFGIQVGDTVDYNFNDDGSISLLLPAHRLPQPDQEVPALAPQAETVFAKQTLAHVHIEPFRPESLNYWDPENEYDVFMVFGFLQEYTEYRYCCGLSQQVINRLGYKFKGKSKPDAIVIEEGTGRYLIAEWKKNSSDFKANHDRDDVDVLVVWNDDEDDKDYLPKKVLRLREVARTQASEMLAPETPDAA